MVTPVIEKISGLEEYEIDALTISPQVTDIANNSGFFRKVHFINFLKDSLLTTMNSLFGLRKEKYDISILVFPSNHYKYQIVHFIAGAKNRYGMKYVERNFPNLTRLSGKLLKEDRSLHAIEQNFRLFEFALDRKIERSVQMTIALNGTDRELADEFIRENSLEGKTLIGIHAGSDTFKNMEKKRWGTGKYIALIRSFSGNCDLHFILFGGKPENDLNEGIRSEAGENCSFLKNASFFHSAALIEKCKVFICGDTGLMHTAAALNIPVIAIFGPTSSVYTRPLNEGSVVVKKDHQCIPCYEYSRTPLFCDEDREYKCLSDITVDEIAEILKSKLNLKG